MPEPADDRRSRSGRAEAMISGAARIGKTKVTAGGRLLAEAVRCFETAPGAVGRQPGTPATADAAALEKARTVAGPVEAKIVARAGLLPAAEPLKREISHLRGLLRGVAVAGLAIAAAAGAATARTAFAGGDGTTVNVFWLLASLLALNLLSFALWLALMVAAPRSTSGGVLGSAVVWLWRRAADRFGAGLHRTAAATALGARWGGGRTGRWVVSGLSHALWSAYLLGALAMALILLSAQHYTFVWETTILDAAFYIALTDGLAALPAAIGIAVPDRAAVLAAQWPGSAEAGQEVLWSSLLIAAILLYGLLPRVLALLASAGAAWRSAATSPLDVGQPYYAELAAKLSPLVGATRIVDDDAGETARPAAAPDLDDLPAPPPPGPVYLLGWEIDEPEAGWPPPGTPDAVRDLGRRDGHAELEQAVAALTDGHGTPARVVVAADLRQTPDRGVTAALAALDAVAPGRLVVLLTGAGGLDRRLAPADISIRVADWAAAGHAAGIDAGNMVAIDLDRTTEDTRRRLAQLLGPPS